jgi:2',3'-cyclic-nucleotide 2'-phosphodiesterase (5'-nucleotidase family)
MQAKNNHLSKLYPNMRSLSIIHYPLSIILILCLCSCNTGKVFLADEKGKNIRMDASAGSDPAADSIIAPYSRQIAASMNEVIGHTVKELTLGEPESLLGDWAAETLHTQSEKYFGKTIDFTTINLHGLRIRSLPKGDVTRGKIFEMMPFENAIYVLHGDSAVVTQFFNHMVTKGGWPIAHATYQIKNGKLFNLKINGQPLRGGREYTFVQSDYIANGGDNCTFLKPLKRDILNVLMRDAFIEGVIAQTKAGKALDAELDNRVLTVNE